MQALLICDVVDLDFTSCNIGGDEFAIRAVNPCQLERARIIAQRANATLAGRGVVAVCDTLAPDPPDGNGAVSAKFFTDFLPPDNPRVLILHPPERPPAVPGFPAVAINYELIDEQTIAGDLARATMNGIEVLPEDHPIRQIFEAARALNAEPVVV